MGFSFLKARLKDQSLSHIPCILFSNWRESQCLPASTLLHPIMLRRTACVFPVSLSKFHFFNYFLEFNISSVTDYVCLCMPTVSTQRYTAWTSFQAGLTLSYGNAVSRDPVPGVFEDLPPVTESQFTSGHAHWGLSIFDDMWGHRVQLRMTLKRNTPSRVQVYSSPSPSFHICHTSINTLNSISSSASRKPSLQSSSSWCPSAQPGPMTWMLPLDHILLQTGYSSF